VATGGLFIDTNLLVLLTVGSVGRDLIAKHRRLREYTAEDYDLLLNLLGNFDRVFVTPNTLMKRPICSLNMASQSVQASSIGCDT
jgi:hypothetical protein